MKSPATTKAIQAAIFLLPLSLVMMGLQYSTRFAGVMDNDHLEEKAALAKAAGFTFERSDLTWMNNPPPGNNGFEVIQKEFLPKRTLFPDAKDSIRSQMIDGYVEPLTGPALEVLVAASHLGQFENCNPEWYVSEGLYEGELVWLASEFDSAILALTYEAVYRAKKGQAREAISFLRLALNIARQAGQQPNDSMASFWSHCQGTFYQACVNVAHELKKNPQAVSEVVEIVESEIPLASIRLCLQYEFYRGMARWRDFKGYSPFVNSLISLTGPGGKCEPLEEYPKSTDGVGSGLPRAMVARTMTAHFIDVFLKFDKILRTEKNLQRASEMMDDAKEPTDKNPYRELVSTLIPYRAGFYLNWSKPASLQAMAKWAIEIEEKYGDKCPDSLPTRKDPSTNGLLEYKKLGDQFAVLAPHLASNPKKLSDISLARGYRSSSCSFVNEARPTPQPPKSASNRPPGRPR